jgi:hypothetical protein
MVSEIPDPTLKPASNTPYVQKYTDARKAFLKILSDNGLNTPTQTLNGDTKGNKFKIPVTITGIGFWDIYGHQNSNTGQWVGHGTGSAISGREIHPIMSMSVAGAANITTGTASTTKPSSNPQPNIPQSPSTPTIGGTTMGSTSPERALAFFLLAALLGMAGQIFHLIVGLKKASDANPDKKMADIFSGSQFLISLAIAAFVGAIAAVLAGVVSNSFDIVTSNNFYTFIAAGYAGTDFIEGFVMKN